MQNIKETLATVYAPSHESEEGEEALLKKNPASPLFVSVVEHARVCGRIQDALRICKEGLDHHPNFIAGHMALARCYLSAGLSDQAKIELEWVLQRAPDNLLALRLLCDYHARALNHQEHLYYLKRAYQIDPTNPQLAEALHSLDQRPATNLQTPRKELSPSNSPNDSAPRLVSETLADLYLAQGHFQLAYDIYVELKAAQPTPGLEKKIHACQNKLRLDRVGAFRRQKIKLLQAVLRRCRKDAFDTEKPRGWPNETNTIPLQPEEMPLF